jgi:glutamate-1-semialdehyde 2,1-aminomutase
MDREKSWDQITQTGRKIGNHWKELAQKYNLPLEISGLPALISFTVPVENWLKYKTLITQEMLKKGILATNTVYVSIEHTEDIVDVYIDHLDPVLSIISECETGRNIDQLIEGPVCHSGFNRLN